MALEKRSRRSGWRFLRRFLLLTGLVAGAGALVYWTVTEQDEALYAAYGAGAVAALMLLIELLAGVGQLASRRGAVGFNVVVQVALALVLVAGGNIYSYFHHHRWDLTQEQIFTLDEKLREELQQLRGDTTIVVHLRHVTSGYLKDNRRDEYDAAAEAKVREKVRDLAEQFQELGPRFKVVTLDVQEKGYADRLKSLTEKNEPLKEAIQRSGENSIFFATGDRVQRLGFAQVFQLDKKASREADGGRGNLVLRPQGTKPFANAALNVDEKRPRVAFGIIHPILGLETKRPVTSLSGLGPVLQAQGIDGFDLFLKKIDRGPRIEPVAVTFKESKYEQLERQVAGLSGIIPRQEAGVKELRKERDFWANTPLEEMNAKFAIAEIPGGIRLIPVEATAKVIKAGFKVTPLNAKHRELFVRDAEEELALGEEVLAELRKQRDEAEAQKARLPVDEIAEQRRIADVRVKLKRLLAEVDLLVVPRLTLLNLPEDEFIPNWWHGLDAEQVEAIKEFIAAGKPVLFLMGPGNLPPDDRPPPGIGKDHLEGALAELGFKLPQQTVLHNSESQAQRRGGLLTQAPTVQVPPLAFDWPAGAGLPRGVRQTAPAEPHPLRRSLRLVTRGLEKELDVRVRYARPVYYTPPSGTPPKTDFVFLMSSPQTWNEAQPFPVDDKMPTFDPPKARGKEIEPELEERRGPFPIGVAAEVKAPASWPGAGSQKARVAVVGSGDLFAGDTLSPAREKMFLDLTNWLLGRDDQLASESAAWQYPRVKLDNTEEQLWLWGARLGLPLLFVYFGLVMWMIRRMR